MLPESSGGRILTETPEISPVKSGLSGCSAAVDLGTTTVAVRLYDLETGIELATDSAWNAQAAYGGDVISRIRHTMDVPDGLGELSRIIRSQVEDMISSALAHCGRDNSSLRHSVLVGNTVMQHIFAHFPVQSIAAARLSLILCLTTSLTIHFSVHRCTTLPSSRATSAAISPRDFSHRV